MINPKTVIKKVVLPQNQGEIIIIGHESKIIEYHFFKGIYLPSKSM